MCPFALVFRWSATISPRSRIIIFSAGTSGNFGDFGEQLRNSRTSALRNFRNFGTSELQELRNFGTSELQELQDLLNF
jgi:hypothetical protein